MITPVNEFECSSLMHFFYFYNTESPKSTSRSIRYCIFTGHLCQRKWQCGNKAYPLATQKSSHFHFITLKICRHPLLIITETYLQTKTAKQTDSSNQFHFHMTAAYGIIPHGWLNNRSPATTNGRRWPIPAVARWREKQKSHFRNHPHDPAAAERRVPIIVTITAPLPLLVTDVWSCNLCSAVITEAPPMWPHISRVIRIYAAARKYTLLIEVCWSVAAFVGWIMQALMTGRTTAYVKCRRSVNDSRAEATAQRDDPSRALMMMVNRRRNL